MYFWLFERYTIKGTFVFGLEFISLWEVFFNMNVLHIYLMSGNALSSLQYVFIHILLESVLVVPTSGPPAKFLPLLK